MKSSEELLELHGPSYTSRFEKNQSPIRLARLIKHIKLAPNMTVADFACGNGMLMEHVAGQVDSYVGVDSSESFIEAANRRRDRLAIDNASFVLSTAHAFCKENEERFDVALAMDFAELFYDEEWVATLRSIHDSLKEKGRLYLHTPNATFFLELMKEHGFLVRQFREHVAVRTPQHNVALLEESGFTVHRLILMAHYNILRLVHPLSFVPFVGKYLKARIFIEAVR